MRKNSISMGEKYIEGCYNRVMAAGELHITNSHIKALYIAGQTDIHHSTAGKLRGAGEIKADCVNFGNIKVAGEINLHGICKGDVMVAIGGLSAEFLECRILRNGAANKKAKTNSRNFQWRGLLKAETFENFYSMDLSSCHYEFKNIISSALLACDNEIVCENFYSFEGLHCQSINAENITLVLNDDISVKSIMGSNIRILKSFQQDKQFKSIPKSTGYKNFTSNTGIVSIQSIEGDRINIEHTRAQLVSGIDVKIGDLCVIDRVEYKNSIKISEKAVIEQVVRL
jgi:hypothetical protein